MYDDMMLHYYDWMMMLVCRSMSRFCASQIIFGKIYPLEMLFRFFVRFARPFDYLTFRTYSYRGTHYNPIYGVALYNAMRRGVKELI